jgi:hypothetical protein
MEMMMMTGVVKQITNIMVTTINSNTCDNKQKGTATYTTPNQEDQ